MENRIDVERMGGDLNRKRSKDILSLVCNQFLPASDLCWAEPYAFWRKRGTNILIQLSERKQYLPEMLRYPFKFQHFSVFAIQSI